MSETTVPSDQALPPKKKRGPKKGTRPSGRRKGSRNKSTLEREAKWRIEKERETLERLAAQPGNELAAAMAKGKKLGKEVLNEFMELFAGMAAYYQPLPENAPQRNTNADEAKFLQYATLAVDAAKAVAPFQSPRYSAVMVGAATVTKVKVTGGMPSDFDPPAPGAVDFKPGTIVTAEDELPANIIDLPKAAAGG